MKKLVAKLRRKEAQPPEAPGRITNDTLAEHREQVLAGGRRFKYPVQYARHKLVINATIISIAAVVLLTLFGWFQLYVVQNTSDFMYRVTRVIPVPVASVDDVNVRYSDYLLKYRGSIHYLREIEGINFATEDGQRQADFIKQQELNDTIADTYALSLARDLNITVSDEELEQVLRAQRQSDQGEQSEAAYYTTINDYYGWSRDEFRDVTKTKLIRQKVAIAIDNTATETSATVGQRISSGEKDLRKLAAALNDSTPGSVQYGAPGFLPRSNQDGGVTAAASKLKSGQISEAIQSSTGEGYFFVKIIGINSREVNYEYIQIPLTVLASQIGERLADDSQAVQRFISIPEVEQQTREASLR